jgi:hypothetical protein
MHRLARPLLLLVAEGRLVHQQVRALGGLDRRRAGARVAGDHDRAPGARRADERVG